MKIGFDAYYAFHYKTGVAHYGRNLINSLARFYPEVEYCLFTDVRTELFQPQHRNVQIVELGREIPYRHWIHDRDLHAAIRKYSPDIFHGLDHAIPSISDVRRVVTIHDLFFESHPSLYNAADVAFYSAEARSAVSEADRIIAISSFTKQDTIARYNVDASRISVCYQSCNPLFFDPVQDDAKLRLRRDFDLPSEFWLYVGSITERKNLLQICRALNHNKHRSSIPLVVIGEGNEYLQTVRAFLQANEMQELVRFISYHDAARSLSFQQAKDVPAFYSMSKGLLYPSLLEGFGIPLVEAFATATPVITAASTCLPEVAGNAALFVDPLNEMELAEAMWQLESDALLRNRLLEEGMKRKQIFSPEQTARSLMAVYESML